jgi:hypothetical protein
MTAVVCDVAARRRGKAIVRKWKERGGDGP